MVEVKMGTVRERTDITEEGTFERYYDVVFYVGDAKHHLRMSPDGWTAKKAEAAVAVKAKELVAAQDKTIDLSK